MMDLSNHYSSLQSNTSICSRNMIRLSGILLLLFFVNSCAFETIYKSAYVGNCKFNQQDSLVVSSIPHYRQVKSPYRVLSPHGKIRDGKISSLMAWKKISKDGLVDGPNDTNRITRLRGKATLMGRFSGRVKDFKGLVRNAFSVTVSKLRHQQQKVQVPLLLSTILTYTIMTKQVKTAGPYSDATSFPRTASSREIKRPVKVLSKNVKQPLVISASKSLRRLKEPKSQIMKNPSIESVYFPTFQVANGGGTKQVRSTNDAFKDTVVSSAEGTKRTLHEAFDDLQKFLAGPKTDTLLLLLATALITPICKQVGTSPILGFLGAGMLLGPNGFGLISGIHTTETLAELGIVFFLFEMGIELSVGRLLSMKRDVFGLGLGQFLLTSIAVASVGKLAGLPANALIVIGGGLALSSSAFVLQLLKDKDQLATRFGRASFGVLLFQDLAVVPLLVVTPILAGTGSLANAVGSAILKAAMALGGIAFAGRVILNPFFKLVAQAKSQEAFLGLVLLTVLSMSFLTEGLGLSNTLGAFLAGVLLSETKYRYQVEADIAPFRGVLLGLFFVTVGFEIDLKLIASKFPVVSAVVFGLIGVKTIITTLLSMSFGLSLANAQQTGFILSQGGEFAFVAFGLARGLGILDPQLTKLLLTCIALSMALTPFLASISGKIAKRIEEGSDFSHYLGQDPEAIEISESEDFVVVAGYGVVGKVVCDLLDAKFIRYVGLEIDPNKAIQARNKGLPVFYGDVGRPEVCEAFNVGKAKAAIIAIAEQSETNRVVISLRRQYPELKIFARAKDANHQKRLQKTLDVIAMVPILPEDNLLLTLPFGGAALRALGAPAEEVNAILEAKRKELLSDRGFDTEEESTVLAQLGIDQKVLRQEKSSADRTNESNTSTSSGLLSDSNRESMVAQVISANTMPKTGKDIEERSLATEFEVVQDK